MKDELDTKTGDLLASPAPRPGSVRQAEFKARKEADGYKRTTGWIHQDSWQAGRDAGQARRPATVPAGFDSLSWFSGYIEGKASKKNGRA